MNEEVERGDPMNETGGAEMGSEKGESDERPEMKSGGIPLPNTQVSAND